MSNLPPNYTTGVGRIVAGSVFDPVTTNMEGEPLTKRDGSPRNEYFIRVAFPKNAPETADMISYLYKRSAEEWPAMFQSGSWPARFSNKLHDGDDATPDKNGKPKNERPGYAGHWLVDFKQPTTPPKVVDEHRNPIADPNDLRRGYYVRVVMSVKGNGSKLQPGVFVTHRIVQRCGFGEVIEGGIDIDAALADPIGALPPGASAPPLAPSTPPTGAPAPVPTGAPAPAPAQAPVTPLPGFMAPPAAVAPPPAAVAPPPAPAPAGPTMTAAATAPYETYKAAGWTDEQLREQGLMA